MSLDTTSTYGARMRRLAISLLLTSLAAISLTGCQEVKVGARCSGSGAASSGQWVVVCKKGRWTKWVTKVQGQALLDAYRRSLATTPPTTAVHPTTAPPTTVPVGPRAVAATVGEDMSCAVVEDGHVRCWGADDFGQLGFTSTRVIGNQVVADTPGEVVGLTGAIDVAVGRSFGCALVTGGTVSCWGADDTNQLGRNTGALSSFHPLGQVPGLTGVTQIDATSASTCAVTSSGSLYCWGGNSSGTLGTGDTNPRPTPTQVAITGHVVKVSVGSRSTCALRDDGTVVAERWRAGATTTTASWPRVPSRRRSCRPTTSPG